MSRQQVLATAFLWWWCLPVMAEPMLSMGGLPETYVPGSSFTFSVRLVGASELNLYSIDLLMAAQGGNPGIECRFDESQTVKPAVRYVFGDPTLHPDGFWASANVDGELATLNLSDLLAPEEVVSTVGESNDLVANITVATAAGAGDLTFTFDTEFLELLDDLGNDIAGFDGLVAALQASETHVVRFVPEPSAFILIVVGMLPGLVGSLWRIRRTR